jgi:hypothetical protein
MKPEIEIERIAKELFISVRNRHVAEMIQFLSGERGVTEMEEIANRIGWKSMTDESRQQIQSLIAMTADFLIANLIAEIEWMITVNILFVRISTQRKAKERGYGLSGVDSLATEYFGWVEKYGVENMG